MSSTKYGSLIAICGAFLTIWSYGCATAPSDTVLVGTFGNVELALTASDIEVRYKFACGGAVTGPLKFDASGRAHVNGMASFWAAGSRPMGIAVEARHSNIDVLELWIRFGEAEPVSYQLQRDVIPTLDANCLASLTSPRSEKL